MEHWKNCQAQKIETEIRTRAAKKTIARIVAAEVEYSLDQISSVTQVADSWLVAYKFG